MIYEFNEITHEGNYQRTAWMEIMELPNVMSFTWKKVPSVDLRERGRL
jgi:hypothetical protein